MTVEELKERYNSDLRATKEWFKEDRSALDDAIDKLDEKFFTDLSGMLAVERILAYSMEEAA